MSYTNRTGGDGVYGHICNACFEISTSNFGNEGINLNTLDIATTGFSVIFCAYSIFRILSDHRKAVLGLLDKSKSLLPIYVIWFMFLYCFVTFDLLVTLYAAITVKFTWIYVMLTAMSRCIALVVLWTPVLFLRKEKVTPRSFYIAAGKSCLFALFMDAPITIVITLNQNNLGAPGTLLSICMWYGVIFWTISSVTAILLLCRSCYTKNAPSWMPNVLKIRPAGRFLLPFGLLYALSNWGLFLSFVLDVAIGWCFEVAQVVFTLALLPAIFYALSKDSSYWRKQGVTSRSTEYTAKLEELPEEWQIEVEELTIDRPIGRGASGVVSIGSWRGVSVAVKELYITTMGTDELGEFIDEVEIIRQLHHPNIVQFFGAAIRAPKYYMVYEYMNKGDLASVLHDKSVRITWRVRCKLCMDIAKGLLYLHSRDPPVIHRDMKSMNVLVDDSMTAKVCDFGLAKAQQSVTMTAVGTPLWQAPELLLGKRYTEKADVYSYGIILWELLMREFPYEEIESPYEVYERVALQGYRPQIPESCPDNFRKLMELCWHQDPDQRPSFDVILQMLKSMSAEVLGDDATHYSIPPDSGDLAIEAFFAGDIRESMRE